MPSLVTVPRSKAATKATSSSQREVEGTKDSLTDIVTTLDPVAAAPDSFAKLTNANEKTNENLVPASQNDVIIAKHKITPDHSVTEKMNKKSKPQVKKENSSKSKTLDTSPGANQSASSNDEVTPKQSKPNAKQKKTSSASSSKGQLTLNAFFGNKTSSSVAKSIKGGIHSSSSVSESSKEALTPKRKAEIINIVTGRSSSQSNSNSSKGNDKCAPSLPGDDRMSAPNSNDDIDVSVQLLAKFESSPANANRTSKKNDLHVEAEAPAEQPSGVIRNDELQISGVKIESKHDSHSLLIDLTCDENNVQAEAHDSKVVGKALANSPMLEVTKNSSENPLVLTDGSVNELSDRTNLQSSESSFHKDAGDSVAAKIQVTNGGAELPNYISTPERKVDNDSKVAQLPDLASTPHTGNSMDTTGLNTASTAVNIEPKEQNVCITNPSLELSEKETASMPELTHAAEVSDLAPKSREVSKNQLVKQKSSSSKTELQVKRPSLCQEKLNMSMFLKKTNNAAKESVRLSDAPTESQEKPKEAIRPQESSEEEPLSSHQADAVTLSTQLTPTTAKHSITKQAQKSASERRSVGRKKISTKDESVKLDTVENANAQEVTKMRPEELSDSHKCLFDKHETMRSLYSRRADELLLYARGDEFRKLEQVDVMLPEKLILEKAFDETFPDEAVGVLACLIEGKSCPLSLLAANALAQTQIIVQSPDSHPLTLDSVIAKIKLIATRKNYFKVPITLGNPTQQKIVISPDKNEDENVDCMWRWEVTLLDILPSDCVPNIKKARLSRRKVSLHFNSITRLLSCLAEADKALLAGADASKLDLFVAKVSQEEEKVLKFDREAEKAKLIEDTKRAKDAARERELTEKKLAAEEKRREIELKKQEALNERKKKEELKAQKEKVELAQKDAELEKQKKTFKSFFSNKVNSAVKKTEKIITEQKPPVCPIESTAKQRKVSADFDVNSFHLAINSGKKVSVADTFPNVAKKHRCKKTRRRVSVTVFVNGTNQDSFMLSPQFAEPVNVEVLNKYKFFSFHEDIRPPYFGTWSKQSSIISGRNPFGKDPNFLEYDYDSEGDWEEGDDELGEELRDDNMDDDEEDKEEDGEMEEAEGWLAPDDEIDEELDEETKLLQRRKIENSKTETSPTIVIIAPKDGSPPGKDDCADFYGEGFDNEQEYFELLDQYTCTQQFDCDLLLDAFPPPIPDDVENSDLLSDDDMRSVARFIHNSPLESRPKMVEELCTTLNTIEMSRSKAFRILDTIAEKKKHPIKGTFWEVKKDVLENLGLDDLYNTPLNVRVENMRTVACFIHNSTCSSKNKIVEELRLKHELATTSRAEAMRIFDLITEKRKHPISGIYWQVKDEFRDELGLKDVLSSSPPLLATLEPVNDETKRIDAAVPLNMPDEADAPDQPVINIVKSPLKDDLIPATKKRGLLATTSPLEKSIPVPSSTGTLIAETKTPSPKPAVKYGSAKILENFLIKKKHS